MPSVRISITRRSRLWVAPEAVFLQAIVSDAGVDVGNPRRSYDESFHRLHYTWDFGDTIGLTASEVVRNLPATHNDLNRAYGKSVAHVFTKAGRFRVRCEVRTLEGAFIGEDETEIEVADPAQIFSGASTVLVDPGGRGDPDNHRGATIVPTLDAALAHLNQPGQLGRILLPRGTSHARRDSIRIGRNFGAFYLGSWGEDGLPPRIEAQSGGDLDRGLLLIAPQFAGDAVIDGIAFRGLWDSTTERGRQVILVSATQANDKYHLLTGCRFDRAGSGVMLGDTNDPTNSALTLHNCDITDWGDYAVYVGRSTTTQNIAVIGSAIHQHPRAMMGGGNTKDWQRNQHGPIRLTRPDRAYIACSDLFSRNGWTGGEIGADQPCLRWHSNAYEARSAGVVERVAMEGGFTIVAISDATAEPVIYGTNVMFDKCLMVGTARTQKGFDLEYTGVTIRNCLYIQPERPLITASWNSVFGARHDDVERRDASWPVEIYANTIVNRMSDADRRGAALRMGNRLDEFDVFSDQNNVYFAPNAPSQATEIPDLLETPLQTVGGVWTSRYLGPSYNDRGAGAQPNPDGRYATPEGTVFTYAPAPGAAVINTAMGLTAPDDFYGRPRDETPDRGAVEA